ncbi:hypothetical protein KLP40_09460 [Hymenobacter sp. NST-14]|uniref:hypothetical protein n=1 Tax=Hymenobacter piscis TaxID=2839984 RepID=UPI001C02B75A|nr:hypothetical protein [Hymenobacter piscis]MBT9393389.1 hypothetical protein [Hymenobacter piscis]
MPTFYFHLRSLAVLLLLLLIARLSYAQTEGTFQSYPTIVCPGEQTTLRLTVADNITVADAPALTNATLVFYPAKTGNVIDCTVRWNDVAAQGTVVFKLKKTTTVKNSDGTTTTSDTYPPSPTVTVGIQSVRDRMPALINGTTNLNVPLCSNGQPITFTLPQEYFVGASSVPITEYVWQVPTGYQVVNPVTSPDFPGGYLSGRSLSVIPPASTTGGIVRVYQYSRACNENTNFNNPGARS